MVGSRPHAGPGLIRIIGGRWRGRRIQVPDVPGLRPTPDRIRETLFNWLQPIVSGARCLDLFSGSGALAFEALSRGAAEVVAVERDATAVTALKHSAAILQVEGLQIHQAAASVFLAGPPRPFDVVFLDPPFDSELLPEIQVQLTTGWLATPAWIYLECAPGQERGELPGGWDQRRQKRAGDVIYRLVRSD
ncbi:MAG: 16S rRNA (guanine(966)-N(2))-methyltransferase RsmD [Gammaproteobacteria bacterium]|nr:MAG: 16S rRNA (guanine(966)-N(2))-methyltransferase RsmD [Gammaproteobacteria bacterium]